MKSKAKFWSNSGAIGSVLGLAAVSLSTVAMTIQPVVAAPSSHDNNPGIAPIQSHPDGKTYGQWAAAWWQWVSRTPASTNPLLDKLDPRDCSVEQKGHVWFLGGTLPGDTREAVVRNCTVPTGTKLFFPIINTFYGAFLNDTDRTEKYVREQVAFIKNENVSLIEVQIDGVPVKNPSQYLEESPLFDVLLPTDNIYGLTAKDAPQLLLSPSVDRGYYLFLQPLPPGTHIIKWKAKVASVEQNVTYNIVVQPGRN